MAWVIAGAYREPSPVATHLLGGSSAIVESFPDAAERVRFVERVRARVEERNVDIDVSVDELLEMADYYKSRHGSYAIRSPETTARQLTSAGFAVDSRELAPLFAVEDEWRTERGPRGQVVSVGVVATRERAPWE